MNTALNDRLAESRRDALVAHYLHTVVTKFDPAIAAKITTADDLYEYLLLDTQVSANVTTSRIAEAQASVQLYMHRCRENLEPGTDPTALAAQMKPGGYFSLWDAYNKRYGTWAGLQRLLRYPANYIDPALRYEKTDAFAALEDALGQGRLTSRQADAAFHTYVAAVSDMLSIDYVAGYQNVVDDTGGRTYFLGVSTVEPQKYYWRSTDTLGPDPISWSQWQAVKTAMPALDGIVGHPFIIVLKGLVRVLWFTDETEGMNIPTAESPDADSDIVTPIEKKVRMLTVATLRNDESWTQLRIRTPILDDTKKTSHARPANDELWTNPWQAAIIDIGLQNERIEMLEVNGDAVARSIQISSESEVHFDSMIRFEGSGDLRAEDHARDGEKFTTRTLPRPIVRKNNPEKMGDCTLHELKKYKNSYYFYFTYEGKFTYTLSAELRNQANQELSFTWFKSLEMFSLRLTEQQYLANFDKTVHLVVLEDGNPHDQHSFKLDASIATAEYDYIVDAGVEFTIHPDARSWSCLYYENGDNPTYHRYLSTYAGHTFTRRAQDGFDSLFSYAAQTEPVDPELKPGDALHPVNWEGGVGQYTWEMFFHAPFLVACRLIDEQRFDDAEIWLRRIMSPSGYVKADGTPEKDDKGNIRYWNVRPLQEDTAWNTDTPPATDDPDRIAMNDPMHYKLAVYLRWMKLLLDRGDMAYRQQTRDTLTEAKMWYTQAHQLLGTKPYFHTSLGGLWSDPTLAAAASKTNTALDALAGLVEPRALALPEAFPGQLALVDGVFLPPIDADLVSWWDRFERRLYNLRHGLSLDGQPLLLPLYETPVSPRDLQRRQLAADTPAGGATIAPPRLLAFRFVVLLDRARSAVQVLMQFGNTLQGILERRDADALSVLQQTQQVAIVGLAKDLHAFNLDVIEHTQRSLFQARATADQRRAHYAGLYEENISAAEQKALEKRETSAIARSVASGAMITAAGLDLVPNTWIAGMAAGVGGTVWGAVARAVSESALTDADVQDLQALKLDSSEQYRRRRAEWGLLRDQAIAETAQIDAQIDAQKAQLAMARKQAQQTDIEQGYAQAVLDMLGTRFSGKALFNWQAGRISSLYYQLYDAALGICAWAQKAYNYESGDTKVFLQPGAWDDLHQGLLAGESLWVGLQRMDQAYLQWDQRTIDVERTLSLNSLASKPIGELIAAVLDGKTNADGPLKVTRDGDVLKVSFALKDAAIAEDYPPAMNLGDVRRIKTISVTLPALLGPYEDVRAVLDYTGGYAANLNEGCSAAAISHGLSDSGQFVLDFNDGKYLPFEGIPIDDGGTLSLRFPIKGAKRSQEVLLRSVNDVVLHIRYTVRRSVSSVAGIRDGRAATSRYTPQSVPR